MPFVPKYHLVVVVEGIGFDRREDGRATARILERRIDVIVHLSVVGETVQPPEAMTASGADSKYQLAAFT